MLFPIRSVGLAESVLAIKLMVCPQQNFDYVKLELEDYIEPNRTYCAHLMGAVSDCKDCNGDSERIPSHCWLDALAGGNSLTLDGKSYGNVTVDEFILGGLDLWMRRGKKNLQLGPANTDAQFWWGGLQQAAYLPVCQYLKPPSVEEQRGTPHHPGAGCPDWRDPWCHTFTEKSSPPQLRPKGSVWYTQKNAQSREDYIRSEEDILKND